MAKKVSFNDLPSAVEKILEILSSEESGHEALPALVQKIDLLEKKIDYLQRTVSPEKHVMDMQAVCRVLKIRPKAVKELADSGALPYRTEGRKTLFYEDGVVRYFMTQPLWGSAVSKPDPEKSDTTGSGHDDIAPDGRQRVDINGACEILDRSAAAIYQLTASRRIPFHKEGKKVYFYSDELREWSKNHPPLKRRKKKF